MAPLTGPFTRASVRVSRLISLLAVLLAGAAGAGVPQRLVSINLCTDQLAMMLAAPGQLVSVSYLARDPRSSAMADEAAGWPVNRGGAEEIYLLNPDLVLGGTYTTPATVSMLRRLGIRVELLPPADSFEETARQIREVGRLLGRAAEGEALARAFEDRLARFPDPGADRLQVALYAANGLTSGPGTLAHQIVERAGFANVVGNVALPATGYLALERLVLAEPDVIVTSQVFPGRSEAEAVLDHPALMAMKERAAGLVTDADWVCGLPQTLDAVQRLVDLRLALEDGS